MLISWTKLLFTLIVNKRKIQIKLKSLFASLILGFRPAAKHVCTTDETDATDSPPVPKRCNVDTPTTSSMQYSSLESMGELMDTEDTQQPADMLPSQVSLSGGNTNKEASEHTVASIHTTASQLLNKTRPSERIFCFPLNLSSLNCTNQLFTRQGQSVTSVSLTNKK